MSLARLFLGKCKVYVIIQPISFVYSISTGHIHFTCLQKFQLPGQAGFNTDCDVSVMHKGGPIVRFFIFDRFNHDINAIGHIVFCCFVSNKEAK